MPSFILLSWWIWSLSKLSPKFWGVPTYVPTYVPPNPQQQNLPQHRSEPSPTTNPWATSPRLACASSSVEAELRSSTCWGSHLQPWVPWVPWRLVGWVLGVEACVGQHLPPTYPPKVEKNKQEPWWNLDEEDFTTEFSDDSYPTMIHNHILSHFRSEVPDLGRLICYSFKMFFFEIGSKLNCLDMKML